MEQLGLPWGATMRGDLEAAWPWLELEHAFGHAGDVPSLARAWARGERDDGPHDLGDALFSDGRVYDAGLALVVALAPALDAAGAEGRFARRWSSRLLALARRRVGGTRWSAEGLVAVMGEPTALRLRVAQSVVPLLPTVRASHRRDLAMPARRDEWLSRWDQALDLLTLEGWTGAAVALDAGWPEDDVWEGLGCPRCGVALHAWTEAEPGEVPCEVLLGTADGQVVVHGLVSEVPQEAKPWEEAPGSWARTRLRGCDVPQLVERLAVRCAVLPCPACGDVRPLVMRAPGALAPREAVGPQT